MYTDGLWIVMGQISAALGVLFGIRLLTEVMPPDVFGSVTLLSGMAALAVGIFSTPIMQAVLRLYPEYASQDGVASLRRVALSGLLRRGLWCYLALLCGLVGYGHFYEMSILVGLLLAAMMATDSIRSLESSLLNAARRQRPFALLSVFEAWGKPLAAVALVQVFGPSVDSVLTGYVVAAIVTLITYYAFVTPEGTTGTAASSADRSALEKRVSSYSLPLVPMGILGWVTGVGDRYLIGGLLGVDKVGIYAAIYGLVSRPFLMLGSAVELTFRPIYNKAVVTDSPSEPRKVLRNWLLLLMGAGGIGFVFFTALAPTIVNVLVAEEYRSGARLVPWIAAGYVLLILSYVFEKVCYAYEATHLILLTQLCGALASLGIAFAAIRAWGLIGAAAAVPAYCGLQLLIAALAANWTYSTAQQAGTTRRALSAASKH